MAVILGEVNAKYDKKLLRTNGADKRVPYHFQCKRCLCDFALLAVSSPRGVSCPSCSKRV